MGIPSYFSYIVKNHPNIIKKFIKNKILVNNLYLDSNSIIYDVIRKLDFTTNSAINKNINDFTNTIIQNIIKQIEEYILCIQPTDTVYIAFDGVAPVAKLNQQRERRYKSWYQNNVYKQIFKKTDVDPFNTAAITPGTLFMTQLNEKLYKYFSTSYKLSSCNFQNIIVSGSDIVGEGEHKLFQHIRDFSEQHTNKTTVIYGLDADLIMLSINHLPLCPNIYLFRETPEFIKSIDSSLEPNENYILDISLLANIITLDMNNGEKLNTCQQTNRIYDYIFMCFFLGNDFLPHFPALNIRTGSINKLIDAYKASIGNTNDNLTDGVTIYWNNVRKIIGVLKEKEEMYIQTEMKLRDRRAKYVLPNETPEEQFAKFEALPTHDRDLEKFINPFKPYWQERYYKSLLKINVHENNDRKKQVAINYLEGLEWTMKYYTTGCADWRWCYKHHYPPLLEDLYNYIPFFNTELISNKPSKAVSPLVQLCYVLPLSSLELLPLGLYEKIIKERQYWYKKDCDFMWAFCRYFWESHAELPEININDLEEFLK
jgi:5'-3' exoribonuclease 1